jgi:type I restriction enzyme, S subunit
VTTDMHHYLPTSWVLAKIEDISETTSGGTPSRKNKNFFTGNIPWLKSGELGDNLNINTAEEAITQQALDNSSAKIIPRDSLLLALYGATVGKLGVLGIDAAINQAICAIQPYQGVNARYLFYYLSSYRKNFLNARKGGAQPNISQGIVKTTWVPLAPTAEQERIVGKVEELFSFLDAGVTSLRAVQVQLKRYRQAVLKAAFEGKLTQQWRTANKDKIEPAQKLLDRIKTERGIDQQEELEKSGVSNEGIPETWQLTMLGIIAGINPNLPKEGYSNDFEVSFLPMRAVEAKTGKFDGTIVKKYAEVKKGFTSFKDGDVVFAKITPCMENGKVAVVRGLKNGVGFGSTEFHVIRFFDNIIPELYYHYLQQDGFRKEAQRNMTGSAGQLRVPVRFLQNVVVPLPPIPEQGAIIGEIRRQFDLLFNVDTLVTQGLAYSTNLRQSILKDAFLGKLVPQSPNDEPAERLLEHIRAERLTNKSKNNQVELLKYVK